MPKEFDQPTQHALASATFQSGYVEPFKHAIHVDRLRTEALAAWSPPIMYDVATDSHRLVTQQDVDGWVKVANTYSAIIDQLRGALQSHDNLARKLAR